MTADAHLAPNAWRCSFAAIYSGELVSMGRAALGRKMLGAEG